MKKRIAVFLFIIVIFSSFVSASNVGLIENQTWQNNLTGSNFHNVAVFGDIDNDGDLDLITAGCTTGSSSCTVADKTYVYINNGTSFVENITWENNLSGIVGGSIAIGDIDNDGDLDLVLSVVSVSGIVGTRIYENNGTTFTENQTWQSLLKDGDNGGADSGSVALGDIDNDGDLDLIFPGMEPNRVVWINNGTSFVNDTTWGQEITTSGGKISTGLVDFDGDGDLDLNVFGQDVGKSYINNGTSFVFDSNWNTNSRDEGNVAWGDIDNDGDFDQVSSGGASVVVGLNNGSEFGGEWDTDEMLALSWGSMMLGDYNNDGYLDFANSGSFAGNRIEIGENNGSAFLFDITASANLTGVRKSSVIWGDVDNDGDLDLVSINSQHVYINNITTSNQDPTPPTSFSSSYNNREISLGWLNGSDNETPSTGLYYNLKLGTASNNHSIISGIYGGSGDAYRGGTAFGYYGNMMQRKNFTLNVDRLQPSTTYNWYVQTIDTGLKAGNWSSIQSFTTQADIERPVITLNSPVDNFNSSSYIFTFNATVFDNLNLSNVSLYGNWTGSFVINQTNSSGINNTDYIFTADLTGYNDGEYIWMIQAEDNATNIQNSSIRTFTLDTTGPNIVIITPTNNTNTSNTGLNVNFTVRDSGVGLESCWYSNDTYTTNTTITCGQNITSLTWSEGNHNVTVYANDTLGNENSSSVSFTIDTINPNINITSPINNTNTTDTGLNVNYTASDTNLESCWYSNDTYTTNTTITCGQNITSLTWSEGNHNTTIWANDSAGNEGQSSVVFTIDTTPPSFNNPRNFTVNVNNSFSENFSATDSVVEIGKYSLNNTSVFNVSQTGLITNITNLSTITIYWLNISVNDTLGNLNSTVFFINITSDFDSPNITLISPANSQSYTSNSQEIIFSYNVTDISDIINCSLIIGGSISSTNFSITKDVNQNFTQTFSPASYNWNVNCTDLLINIGNSSSRSFTVTAPSSPGGGGGGGSTTTVVPKEFDIDFSNVTTGSFEAKQGDVKTFTFNGQITHKIILSEVTSTSVKLIVESEPIIIVLSLGGIKQIDMNGDGINDLEIKLNSITNGKANISLKELEGASILSLEELEEAVRKEALFDVKVSIVEAFKKVFPGEDVTAEIEVFNVNNIGQVDVFVEYYLSDNKTILTKSSDSLAVEAVTSFVRSLRVPENTKPGIYFFGVDVTYKDFTTSGSAEFTVKSLGLGFIRERSLEIIIITIIIVGLIIFFYVRNSFGKLRKKEIKLEKLVRYIKNR